MKNVKLSRSYFYIDKHFEPDQVISVPDSIAADLVKASFGTVVEGGVVANPDANRLHDAVDPLVANADPLHAAKALGLTVDDHPGLVALDDAGMISSRKGGRVKVDPPVVVAKP